MPSLDAFDVLPTLSAAPVSTAMAGRPLCSAAASFAGKRLAPVLMLLSHVRPPSLRFQPRSRVPFWDSVTTFEGCSSSKIPSSRSPSPSTRRHCKSSKSDRFVKSLEACHSCKTSFACPSTCCHYRSKVSLLRQAQLTLTQLQAAAVLNICLLTHTIHK